MLVDVQHILNCGLKVGGGIISLADVAAIPAGTAADVATSAWIHLVAASVPTCRPTRTSQPGQEQCICSNKRVVASQAWLHHPLIHVHGWQPVFQDKIGLTALAALP
eukprot:GHRR01027084.1.p1 GENE.GHRR01027084.1~~GHRR01027084.1.p1  ORF type:complete len:107 (-),score=32.49 GHRR01027084.1:91-411(-)